MASLRTRYGDGILSEELEDVAPYVLVTNPIPERLYREKLHPSPAQTLMPDSLERSELDAFVPVIGEGLSVVGLGGGSVVDAAKYLGHERDVDCLLAPTITSTNAPFSDFVSVRNSGTPVGMRVAGARYRVVVDVSLLRMADMRMNRAGLGDLVALSVALEDAQWAARHGYARELDDAVVQATRELMTRCQRVSHEVGAGSDEGLLGVMEMFADATTLMEQEPALGAGSEHLIAWNLERVTGRHFLHGELVALGTVIGTVLHELDLEWIRSTLSAASVIWRPTDLDINAHDLALTLRSSADYNRDVRRIPAIIDAAEWTDEDLTALHREMER